MELHPISGKNLLACVWIAGWLLVPSTGKALPAAPAVEAVDTAASDLEDISTSEDIPFGTSLSSNSNLSEKRSTKPRDLSGVPLKTVVGTYESECEPCDEGSMVACGCESSYCGGNDAFGASVYLFSGEFYETAVDLEIEGRGPAFVWARKYRSRLGPDTLQGNGWDFSYNIRVAEAPDGEGILLFDGNTRQDLYSPQEDGTFTAVGFYRVLSQEADGSWKLTFSDTSTWSFHAFDGSPQQGKLGSIADRNENTLHFLYDAEGRLVTIFDTLEREVTVAYNTAGFIESVTDFTGRQVRYEYYLDGDTGGSFGDLKSVRSPTVVETPNGNDFPAGKTTVYTYTTAFADEALNHNLLTITDPKGQTYLTNVYGVTEDPFEPTYDAVVRQNWGYPDEVIDFVYVTQKPAAENNFADHLAIVNDRVGNVKEYYFAGNKNVLLRELTGRADPHQPTTETTNRPGAPLREDDPPFFQTLWEYNSDSRATRIVHPNGNEELLTFDSGSASRRSQGNLLEHCRLPGPLGGDQDSICESFEYDDAFGGCCGSNFVTKHVDGRGHATLHTYDANGNRIHTQHRIPSIAEDFEYNAFGQMTARVWPDNGSGHRRRDEFTYYTSGPELGYLQSEIVDSTGLALTTTYDYDAVGNITRIVDPEGHDTLYVINELNQLVRSYSAAVSLSAGRVRYERDFYYDANDNPVRIDIQNVDDRGQIPANSHVTKIYEYEILNHESRFCAEVADHTARIPGAPESPSCASLPADKFLSTEYEYDGNRNLTLVRKGEAVEGRQSANVIRALYDERDLYFREIRGEGDPAQSTTEYGYDGNKNVRSRLEGLEAEPRIWLFTHDGYNRLVTAIDPMGNSASHEYDANHNRIRAITRGELLDTTSGSGGNVRLAEVSYVYDDMDRETQAAIEFFDSETQAPIDDGKAIAITGWSDNSQVLRRLDDNLHETRMSYDTANRIQQVTDSKGNTATSTYDRDSLVVSLLEVDKSDLGKPDQAFVTTSDFDAIHRLIRTTDNAGNTATFGYDSRDNRTVSVDARLKEIRYTYDGIDRQVATIYDLDGDGADGDGADVTTTRTFDDSSRLVARSDDNGNVTSFTHDPLNRVVAETSADATGRSFTYDVHDNRIQRIDANGTVVTSTYDLLDRRIRNDVAPGAGVSADTTFEVFQFDGLSRRVHVEDDDSLVSRSYNSLSKITRETLNGTTTLVAYDGVGNETLTTYPGGRTISTTYDELNRKQTISDGADPIATYFYVGAGRPERREYGNGTYTEYTYDGITGIPNPPGDFGVKHVVRTRHARTADGTVIDDRTYTWDPTYNKTGRRDVRAGGPEATHGYSYDPMHRLFRTVATDSVGGVLRDEQYDFDGVGNRTAVTGGESPGSYVMDPTLPEPADFQTNQYTDTPLGSRSYDKNGNLIHDDAGGVPRDLTYDFRNRMVEHLDADSGTKTSYAYDALGRRIEKTVDDGTPQTTRYFYRGWQVVEEQDTSGLTQASYVYGIYVDEALNMRRAGMDYYYHGDDLYSVMAVTDSSGKVVERYEYGDYGQPVDPQSLKSLSGEVSSLGNPYGFTGRRYDAESSLYYYRTRYLDPSAGRFTSRDVVGIWGDTGNVGNGYTLVGNRPTSSVDPMGLQAWPEYPGISGPYTDEGAKQAFIKLCCAALDIADDEIAWAEKMIGEYQKAKADKNNKTGKDIENAVDKSLEDQGIKTEVAGTTDSSGNVTVKPQSGPAGTLKEMATAVHEGVHAEHTKELRDKHTDDQGNFDQAGFDKDWNDAQDWADDEINAYGAQAKFWKDFKDKCKAVGVTDPDKPPCCEEKK